jgi:hypothetical protein
MTAIAYSTVKTIRPIALGRPLPKAKLPKGMYLVHNLGSLPDTVRKAAIGDDGFRAWVQRGRTNPKLVPCTCKFGWVKNREVNEHYIPEAWAIIKQNQPG